MKKYLIIILFVIFCPCIVFAENVCKDITYDEYCKSSDSTCLSSLQREYNTWNSTNNTGVACIKVIAQINGNTRSYLNGKNPETNYKCSDGSSAIAEKIGSAIPNEQEVTDCNNVTCYVPEIWKMDCGTANTDSSTGNLSNNNNNDNNDNNNDNNDNDNDNNHVDNENDDNNDVSTNSNGQITGTTDTSETGVETYFIVLFIMVIISYFILVVSKKKNLFKSI